MKSFWFRLFFVFFMVAILILYLGVPVDVAFIVIAALPLAILVRFIWCKKKNLEFISGQPIIEIDKMGRMLTENVNMSMFFVRLFGAYGFTSLTITRFGFKVAWVSAVIMVVLFGVVIKNNSYQWWTACIVGCICVFHVLFDAVTTDSSFQLVCDIAFLLTFVSATVILAYNAAIKEQ